MTLGSSLCLSTMTRTSWRELALSCLLVLLIWSNTGCYALSVSEKAAILQLIELFPPLSNTTHSVGLYSRWDASALDTICSTAGPTRPFYGLECASSAVLSLIMYVLAFCCVVVLPFPAVALPHGRFLIFFQVLTAY